MGVLHESCQLGMHKLSHVSDSANLQVELGCIWWWNCLWMSQVRGVENVLWFAQNKDCGALLEHVQRYKALFHKACEVRVYSRTIWNQHIV